MASVIKRGKNWYEITINLGFDQHGTRRRIYRNFRGTKREAEAEAARLEYQHQEGALVRPTKRYAGEYLREWLEGHARELRPRTLANYQQVVDLHLAPYFENILLQEIRPQNIEDYKQLKLTRGRLNGQGGLSNATVQYHMVVLSQALGAATRLQVIPNNPCKHVKRPRVSQPELTFLDPAGVARLLEASRESSIQDLVIAGINTGARKGELLGLTWDKVDLTNQVLSIEQSLYRAKGRGLLLSPVKTRQSKRQVNISQELTGRLKNLKKKQSELQLFLGSDYNQRNFVFCHANGDPFDPAWVNKKLKKITEKAGFPDLRFHDLRHTHVSILLKKGVDPKTIQERVGHASISTLLDVYAHVFPGSQKGIADIISEEIEKNVGKMSVKPTRIDNRE